LFHICYSFTFPHSLFSFFFLILPPPPRSTLFPYTTLFRSKSAFYVRSVCVSVFLFVCLTPNSWGSTPSGTGPAADSASSEATIRSEEHTSELQSLRHLVCRLLLEKKKKKKKKYNNTTKYKK